VIVKTSSYPHHIPSSPYLFFPVPFLPLSPPLACEKTPLSRVQIQKEVISGLKREKNKFLSKEIWESI
jgi:hypothetical protein